MMSIRNKKAYKTVFAETDLCMLCSFLSHRYISSIFEYQCCVLKVKIFLTVYILCRNPKEKALLWLVGGLYGTRKKLTKQNFFIW